MSKSLCLVLALVMVLGLFVVGTNAAYAEYTDNKEISYADAVEILTGLEVIEGYPDGTFKPAESVTRAEAAAMITRMMLGREKADKLPVGDVKFSDVPETNWAAKYIAFCANRGIIVGMGDGTFRPSEKVTGTQMATMLLRALGYGVMGEYEGKGWDINAVADALYYKVFEDSKVTDFSQPATREETALYVFNTLWVDLVAYDVDIDHYVLRLGTFASEVYSLAKWENAQVRENQATGNPYTVVRGTRWYTDNDGEEVPYTASLNFDIETGLDLIAHEVTVYYKTDSREKDKQNNYYYKAFVVQDNSTVLDQGAYYGDMYNNLIAANKNNKYASMAKVDSWINYVYEVDADTLADATHYTVVSDLKGRYTLFDGTPGGDIVLDSDGKMLAWLDVEYTVDQVKKISGNEITLKNDEFEFETYDLELAYEGIKKGDYVTVQPVGDLCYLYETTTEEINVTERSVSADTRKLPTFNNRAVSYGSGFGAVTVPETDEITSIFAGDKVLFYLDCYGGYFAAKVLERGTLQGVVFVNKAFLKEDSADKYGKKDESVYVQCVDEDGKEVIYQLNKDYKTVADAPRGVYKVYTNKDGIATLSEAGVVVTKDEGKTSFIKNGSDIYYVTSDTKVLYVKGELGDMKVTASSALTKESCTVYAYIIGSTTLKNAWIVGEDAPASLGTYMYVYGLYSDPMYVGWNQNSGSMMINETTTYYFTTYIDGTPNYVTYIDTGDLKWKEGSEFQEFWGIKNPTYYVQGGFYTYSVDEFGVFDIEALAPTSTMKTVTVNLTKGNISNGKLYLADTASMFDAEGYDADGVKITASVVNCAYPTTADGKKYLTLNTVEDIEDFLNDNAKNSVVVQYLAVKVNDDWVPTGTMYIIYGSESAD